MHTTTAADRTDRHAITGPCARRGAALGALLITLAAGTVHPDSAPQPRLRTAWGAAEAVVAARDLQAVPVLTTAERPETGAPPAEAGPGSFSPPTATSGPRAVDPLVAPQQLAAAKSTAALSVQLDVAGIAFTGATPADPVGEVGGGRFVQMVNGPSGSVFAVYDAADGSLLSGPGRLEDLWPGAGSCAEGWGHPGVVFDSRAERWVLSELGAGNHLCVYVSHAADPVSSGWTAYDFELPTFPDFPRLGVWSDAYAVATNEDLPAVYVLERDAMLAGAPARWQRLTAPPLDGFGFQALTPVDLDGAELPAAATGALFVRQADGQLHGGGDRIEIFELDVDWDEPAASSLSGPATVPVAAFDSTLCGRAGRSCVPQPDSDVALDPVREVVSSLAHYRRSSTRESVVGSFVVDADGADHSALRWFELRRDAGAGSWSLLQEGTYAPDGLHRWIGGLAADRDGNLLLGLNASGGASPPSLRITGREPADPPGVMTAAELGVGAAAGAQTAGHSPERWGASTRVSLDPADDCTFWVTGAEAADGGWSTRIATVRFPSCDAASSGLIFADGLESGSTSAWDAAVP